MHLWVWGAARLLSGAVFPLETGPRIQHTEQPTLLPSPACQPWRSSTPPGLVYGSPWVWLRLWGGSSPPTDALTDPSASRLQSRARPSVPASELVPHVVLSRVVMAARQEGSVLCPQPVGDVRGACSTGLQGCGSAPSPSLASEMVAEWVPEPRGPGGGHQLGRSALAGSVSWAPLLGRGACALRRGLVGLAHCPAVQQLRPCCTSGASLCSGAHCGNQLR